MSFFDSEIKKELTKSEFKQWIRDKEIIIGSHALDHLSESQRKVFNAEDLLYMLEKETPRKVYMQENGRCRIYYRKKDGYREIILEVKEQIADIVTFLDPIELPKIRLQNGG